MMFALMELDPSAVAARWWTLVVRGIAAILFGVLALVWPGISLLALILLWGAYAVADGVFSIVLSARAGAGGRRWGWLFFQGLVGMAAGVVTFLWPGMTAIVLLTLIAVWALVTGIAEIVGAIELRKVIEGEWLLALSGVLSIVFGVGMLIFPSAGALAVVTIIAIYAIFFGSLLITLGVRLHRLATPGRGSMAGPSPSHA